MTTPTNYIETRKTWIKAIHKCIMEKWNPICMGCVGVEPICGLCDLRGMGSCDICPLDRSGERSCGDDTLYGVWLETSTSCERCNSEHGGEWCSNNRCPDDIFNSPQEAEAMLEALVQLLPESERVIYGG